MFCTHKTGNQDWHWPLITGSTRRLRINSRHVMAYLSHLKRTCFFSIYHMSSPNSCSHLHPAPNPYQIHLDVHELLKHQRLLDEVQHLLNRSRPANVARSQHCHLEVGVPMKAGDLSNHRWQHDIMCQSFVNHHQHSPTNGGGCISKLVQIQDFLPPNLHCQGHPAVSHRYVARHAAFHQKHQQLFMISRLHSLLKVTLRTWITGVWKM